MGPPRRFFQHECLFVQQERKNRPDKLRYRKVKHSARSRPASETSYLWQPLLRGIFSGNMLTVAPFLRKAAWVCPSAWWFLAGRVCENRDFYRLAAECPPPSSLAALRVAIPLSHPNIKSRRFADITSADIYGKAPRVVRGQPARYEGLQHRKLVGDVLYLPLR